MPDVHERQCSGKGILIRQDTHEQLSAFCAAYGTNATRAAAERTTTSVVMVHGFCSDGTVSGPRARLDGPCSAGVAVTRIEKSSGGPAAHGFKRIPTSGCLSCFRSKCAQLRMNPTRRPPR